MSDLCWWPEDKLANVRNVRDTCTATKLLAPFSTFVIRLVECGSVSIHMFAQRQCY